MSNFVYFDPTRTIAELSKLMSDALVERNITPRQTVFDMAKQLINELDRSRSSRGLPSCDAIIIRRRRSHVK